MSSPTGNEPSCHAPENGTDPVLEPSLIEAIDEVLEGEQPSPTGMANLLLHLTGRVGPLSLPAQEYLAERLRVPSTKVQGVVTFYDRLRSSCDAAPVQLPEIVSRVDRDNPAGSHAASFRGPSTLGRCCAGGSASIQSAMEHGVYRTLHLLQSRGRTEAALAQVKRSELSGWGGGTPLGLKMELVARAIPSPKQVVCIVDPSEPGVMIDRLLLEENPHGVLEGMAIAAWIVGASHGLLAFSPELTPVEGRLRRVLDQAVERGVLGGMGQGAEPRLRIELLTCAGFPSAGDEVALLRCIEGRRGAPAPRPPYPAERGLHGRPTLMVSVESLAALAGILAQPAAGRAARGTRLFVLDGVVRRRGLAELELGTKLEVLIQDIGGGVPAGRRLKGAQIGDRAGELLPADRLDTRLEDRSLAHLGCSVGAGGVTVLDDCCCVLQLARWALERCVDQSCGKCPPCRIGARVMLTVLDRVCSGEAEDGDIERLAGLGAHMELTSLCRLGQTAAAPLLAALHHFPEECLAHEADRFCPAGECRELFNMTINGERCVGCDACRPVCPEGAISGGRGQVLSIDQDLCVGCVACREACEEGAVTAVPRQRER